MDSNLSRLAQQFEKRVSNGLMSMKFHFANACVDSDPVVLLNMSVNDNGQEKNLEDVVDISKMDDKTFAFIPHEGTDLDDVVPAVKKEHPEFKTELKIYKKSADGDEVIPVLFVTVPDVDKPRKDVLTEAVNTYKDAFSSYVDAEVNVTRIKMARYLEDATDEDKDAVESLFKDKAKQYKDMAEDEAGKKIEKIEEAYQNYLKEKVEQDKKLEDLASSANKEVAKSMDME